MGWNCTGIPSDCNTICGDGFVRGSERCISYYSSFTDLFIGDDKNDISGDGCSDCLIDPGFTCLGQPSTCSSGIYRYFFNLNLYKYVAMVSSHSRKSAMTATHFQTMAAVQLAI